MQHGVWCDDRASFGVDIVVDGPRRRTVQVCGEVDLASAPLLRRALQEAADRGCDLTVDLSGVTFADTHLGHALVDLRWRQAQRGQRLAVVNIPPRVRRLLTLARFTDELGLDAPVEAHQRSSSPPAVHLHG